MNDATPSLQTHYSAFITTTRCSAPVLSIGTDGGNAGIAGAIYLSPCPNHYDGHLATMLSSDFAKDGVYEENAGAIFFLLFNHLKGCPDKRYTHLLCCY